MLCSAKLGLLGQPGSKVFFYRVQKATLDTDGWAWPQARLWRLPDRWLGPARLARLAGPVVAAKFFPEGVWAKGSTKSGGLIYIFTCSHFHILTCSHTHIFSSSHLDKLTPSHLKIFLPSHLHIFSSSHLRIFTSSNLHIVTHLLSLSALHLHIFTASYLHTLTSFHLHIFLSSHLHIFSLSLSCLCHGLSPSCSFLSYGRKQCRRGATTWPPFRTKWGSGVKNWLLFGILPLRGQSFRTKRGWSFKNWWFFAILHPPRRPFRTKQGSSVKNYFFRVWFAPAARNEVRMTKTESFLRLYILGGNPFARIECQKLTRNEVRVSKTEGFCDFTFSAATLSYEMRFECQKLKVFCDFGWSGGNAFAVCV